MIIQLQEIFREVFDNQNLTITENTSPDEIDDWDSFNHVKLILSLEETFDIKFDVEEVMELNKVCDIISAVKNKKS